MSALQESRRELMVQLEGLMRLLKVKQSSLFQLGAWVCNALQLLQRRLCLRLWKPFYLNVKLND